MLPVAAMLARRGSRLIRSALRRYSTETPLGAGSGSPKFQFPWGKSLVASGATVLGLWYYFRLERSKLLQTSRPHSPCISLTHLRLRGGKGGHGWQAADRWPLQLD